MGRSAPHTIVFVLNTVAHRYKTHNWATFTKNPAFDAHIAPPTAGFFVATLKNLLGRMKHTTCQS
jgi:hypothetical protein